MNKLLGSSILICLSVIFTIGTTGCQKPTKPAAPSKETAPPANVAKEPLVVPELKLDREKIELDAGGKPEIVNVLTKKVDSVDPGKNGVKSVIKKGEEGATIELSADKDAKPGEQHLIVRYLALVKTLHVTVKNGKKEETKKDEVKKDETKKDEPKKDEAKKDDAKKDDLKKEDAKKDDAKKDSPKKDEPKKDSAQAGDTRPAFGIKPDATMTIAADFARSRERPVRSAREEFFQATERY